MLMLGSGIGELGLGARVVVSMLGLVLDDTFEARELGIDPMLVLSHTRRRGEQQAERQHQEAKSPSPHGSIIAKKGLLVDIEFPFAGRSPLVLFPKCLFSEMSCFPTRSVDLSVECAFESTGDET